MTLPLPEICGGVEISSEIVGEIFVENPIHKHVGHDDRHGCWDAATTLLSQRREFKHNRGPVACEKHIVSFAITERDRNKSASESWLHQRHRRVGRSGS